MELKEIKVRDILANFYQQRVKFEKEGIKELSESILSNGLINPPTVRKWKDKHMIVTGERRWRGSKIAGLKTIPCFVKEYKDEISFMIESLAENIHRKDLASMEKAKFIMRIKKTMPGIVSNRELAKKLSVNESIIGEHISLVDKSTPKEVKKAVEEGKLAMRSASMISKLPEKEQVVIAKESMERETGIGRKEVEKLIEEKKPEPIKLERTANDIMDNILSNLHDFKYNVDELKKDNLRDISKSKAGKAMATSGLHVKTFREFVNILRQTGAKPHPLILALIKANGKT